MVVAEGEAAVVEQPGDGGLDLPAVSAESGGGLDAAAGDAGGAAVGAEPGAQLGVVVALVGVELVGSGAAGSAAGADRRDGPDQGLQALAVVGVGRGHPDGQRQAGVVGQHMDLGAGLPRSTGLGPARPPPFCARTLAVSSSTQVQSTCPWAPRSSSTARCSRRHSPAWVHAPNRRCTVAFDTPNPGGRCRHAHPVRSTYTIAASTARGSTIAVPPPCGRTRCGGINGCANAHSSSGTHSRTNRSSTDAVTYHRPTQLHMRHTLRQRPWLVPAVLLDSVLALECLPAMVLGALLGWWIS